MTSKRNSAMKGPKNSGDELPTESILPTTGKSEIGKCLGDAVKTLYKKLWPVENYDGQLYLGLGGCLAALKCDGMRPIGLMAHPSGRQALYYFVPPVQVNSLRCESLRERFQAEFRRVKQENADHISAFVIEDTAAKGPKIRGASTCVVAAVARLEHSSGKSCGQWAEWENYGAVFVEIPSENADNYRRNEWLEFCSEAIVPMLIDVFRHRERRMMPFAPAISRLYWESAAAGEKATLRPPWDDKRLREPLERSYSVNGAEAMRATVTLSVDLRKSTFCMDQSVSPAPFGRWLDLLVKKIISVCHAFGGVFDKFTGDGGLMHFLQHECKAAVEMDAIEAAFRCAVHLRSGIEEMLPMLRRNLRNNSGILGAGVSIAAGDAFWSVDHRDNPLVVGNGVVDACRICDGTRAGAIRMSNFAHSQLAEVNPASAALFKQVPLGETKEWNAKMELLVWEMTAG